MMAIDTGDEERAHWCVVYLLVRETHVLKYTASAVFGSMLGMLATIEASSAQYFFDRVQHAENPTVLYLRIPA